MIPFRPQGKLPPHFVRLPGLPAPVHRKVILHAGLHVGAWLMVLDAVLAMGLGSVVGHALEHAAHTLGVTGAAISGLSAAWESALEGES